MTVNGVFRAVNSGNNQFGSVQSTSTTTTVYGSGGLTVDYSFDVAGSTCQLGNAGSTTSVYTAHNTLDDGSGNMNLGFPASSSTLNGGAARLQIGATADFNGNTYALGVAGPATGAYPFGVMVGTGSGSSIALQVSKFFGVTTKNCTLDDGSGNASFGGYVNATAVSGNSAYRIYTGTTMGTQLSQATSAAQYLSNTAVGDTVIRNELNDNIRLGFVGTNGGTQASSLTLGYPYTVATKYNTLDDGSGNMLVSSSSSLSYTPSTPPLYVKTSGTGGGVIAQFLAANNLTSGAATTISLGVANTNGSNAAWNYVPASTATSQTMGPTTATSPFQSLTFFGGGGGQLYLGGANQPGVFSKNNTLDDGLGSMNVVGNFTLPSSTVQITSGLTATNTASGADNTTINNLVDNNLATEYKPSNNAAGTSNLVTITSQQTLYLTKVTIVYPGGGTAYNTPQSVIVAANGVQQTATCNSSTAANSVQYVSVTFSPAVLCSSFTLTILPQSSGGSPPGWLWECQVFSLNFMSIVAPVRFSNLVSTANNILDDSTGNMTCFNKLTISGNQIINSAGTGYTLPTAAASTIALTSQIPTLPISAALSMSGTSSPVLSIVSQSSGAGFAVNGAGALTFPSVSGRSYTVNVCYTGSVPANTTAQVTGSLTNNSLGAGLATGYQYNSAIAAETYTCDYTFIVSVGSQGTILTLGVTGFTTNLGCAISVRQLV